MRLTHNLVSLLALRARIELKHTDAARPLQHLSRVEGRGFQGLKSALASD